jgi:hypothetical protein
VRAVGNRKMFALLEIEPRFLDRPVHILSTTLCVTLSASDSRTFT